MKNPKKPKWLDEFAAFAIKGNAMSLAVGTIIGAAFSTITKSITDDIIMPIVAIFMGGIDFSELKITLPRPRPSAYSRIQLVERSPPWCGSRRCSHLFPPGHCHGRLL